jgi:hypothetical protein
MVNLRAPRDAELKKLRLAADSPEAREAPGSVLQKSIESPAPIDIARPSPSAIKVAVQDLLPAIKARAPATERNRTVAIENVEALREIGFYKLVQPAAFGGYEFDFAVLVDLIIELGRACASTSWVCGLLAAHQWMLGLFLARAQREIWGSNPGATLCGSYAPACLAVAEADGSRLEGRGSFASGCDNAQWAICSAILPPRADRPSEPAFFLVPRTEYSIDDTWDVIGLARDGQQNARAQRRVCARLSNNDLRRRRRWAQSRQPTLQQQWAVLRTGLLPRLDLSGGDRDRRCDGSAR